MQSPDAAVRSPDPGGNTTDFSSSPFVLRRSSEHFMTGSLPSPIAPKPINEGDIKAPHLADEAVDAIFSRLDSDCNGSVTLSDLATEITRWGTFDADSCRAVLMQEFQIDDHGALSRQDFREAVQTGRFADVLCRCIGAALPAATPTNGPSPRTPAAALSHSPPRTNAGRRRNFSEIQHQQLWAFFQMSDSAARGTVTWSNLTSAIQGWAANAAAISESDRVDLAYLTRVMQCLEACHTKEPMDFEAFCDLFDHLGRNNEISALLASAEASLLHERIETLSAELAAARTHLDTITLEFNGKIAKLRAQHEDEKRALLAAVDSDDGWRVSLEATNRQLRAELRDAAATIAALREEHRDVSLASAACSPRSLPSGPVTPADTRTTRATPLPSSRTSTESLLASRCGACARTPAQPSPALDALEALWEAAAEAAPDELAADLAAKGHYADAVSQTLLALRTAATAHAARAAAAEHELALSTALAHERAGQLAALRAELDAIRAESFERDSSSTLAAQFAAVFSLSPLVPTPPSITPAITTTAAATTNTNTSTPTTMTSKATSPTSRRALRGPVPPRVDSRLTLLLVIATIGSSALLSVVPAFVILLVLVLLSLATHSTR